jgi:hypothetical protein
MVKKPPKRVAVPKPKVIERLEQKQDQELRLKRVKDMLASHEADNEDEDVTIEEANKALEEAGFNAEEIRSFARFLVAQEVKPFTLPARSPEHYTAIRDEVRALTVKLLGAGANIWTIKQSLEGRIEELTTFQHDRRKDQRLEANTGLRSSQTGEESPDGEEA